MKNKNQKYEWYLKNHYYPAQEWSKKTEGKEWIKQYIPTMSDYCDQYYDVANCGIYIIYFDNIPAYVGEAVKICNRLIVHCHNMYNNSLLYFGITKDEIENSSIGITIDVLAHGLNDEEERKQKEKELIREYRPILQKYWLESDECENCIPRGSNRRNRVLKNIPNSK